MLGIYSQHKMYGSVRFHTRFIFTPFRMSLKYLALRFLFLFFFHLFFILFSRMFFLPIFKSFVRFHCHSINKILSISQHSPHKKKKVIRKFTLNREYKKRLFDHCTYTNSHFGSPFNAFMGVMLTLLNAQFFSSFIARFRFRNRISSVQ